MKRVISILLSITLIVSAFVGVDYLTNAAEIIDSGTCGTNLTWELDDEGTLTISGTGSMTDYENFGDISINFWEETSPWYYYADCINSIIIKNGVENIGVNAFYECSNVESVTIPDSVNRINRAAFRHCAGIKNIKIPDSVTYIGNEAFLGCESIENIKIPNNVTYIGEEAFCYCIKLESIVIPDKITIINKGVFRDCQNLTNVIISNKVKRIDTLAFYGCISLKSIVIPDGVEIIGESFEGCVNLESVTIPDSVYSINNWAFYNCSNLTIYCNYNSVAHDYAKEHNINYVLLDHATHSFEKIIVAPTCTEDGYVGYRCDYCGEMYKENDSFETALGGEHNFENNICTKCGTSAFEYTIKKNKIVVYDTKCNMEIVNVPEYIDGKEVGIVILAETDNTGIIKEIYLPKTVEMFNVSDMGFRFLPNLERIVVDENNPYLDSRNDCNAIINSKTNELILGCQNTVIPKGVKSIGTLAFVFCENLTEIKIPNGVEEISTGAFLWCENLNKVVIPRSVTSIDFDDFFGFPFPNNENLILYVYEDSYAQEFAEQYAESCGYNYELINEEEHSYKLTSSDDGLSYTCEDCDSTITKTANEVLGLWNNSVVNTEPTGDAAFLDVVPDGIINAKDYAYLLMHTN